MPNSGIPPMSPFTAPSSVQVDGATIAVNSAGQLTVLSKGLGLVDSVANSDGTLTISPTIGNVVASLNLANANIWTGKQTLNGYLALPLGSSVSPYTPSVTFTNFTDGTVGSVIYSSDSGGYWSGLDELDIVASNQTAASAQQPTLGLFADATISDGLAIIGTSTTTSGSMQLLTHGNFEIDYGSSGTGTFTLAQGASRTPILTATAGASPSMTIVANNGILLQGFVATENNAASGADLAIYGNGATVSSGSNIQSLSLYTEGGEKCGVEMTGTSAAASISFNSIVSNNDTIYFNTGNPSATSFRIGDAAGHPLKITTSKNTLDDGSGNVTLAGTIKTGGGGTAPTAVTVPASGTAYTPSTTQNTELFVSGGTVTAIAINGVSIGLTSGTFYMKANDTITFTYTTAPIVYQMNA